MVWRGVLDPLKMFQVIIMVFISNDYIYFDNIVQFKKNWEYSSLQNNFTRLVYNLME